MQWSQDELIHELLSVRRRAFLRWSGTEVIEGPGWLQLVTPSFRHGGLNEVLDAQLDASEADAVIDAAIARYREHGLHFRWTVLPDARPDDLARRLEQRGLERVELLGMVRELDEVPAHHDSEIRIEQVDVASLADYLAVMAAGWGIDPAPFVPYGRVQLADPLARHRLFLARVDGHAVAAGSCIAFERSLYLQGGVVLPEFRKRGIYRALVEARLRFAAERGLELVTVHAMRSSAAPLLERFGFRGLIGFPSFRGR